MRVNERDAEFSAGLDNFSRSLKEAFFNIMRRASVDMEASLKQSISTVGEVVKGRTMPSPAYSAPYKVSGNLLNSTGLNYIESSNKAVIQAGTDIGRAPYAPYLEYGTSRMKPRPYLLTCGANYFNIICGALLNIKENL